MLDHRVRVAIDEGGIIRMPHFRYIIIVFLALALSRLEMFQQLGVGMAIAVFLDATIVRCGLVPATVKLLGYRNWWFPRGLAKFLPTIWAPETSSSKIAAGETRS